MVVEILNPSGVVSYTRPHQHKDIAEALRTCGYSVRFPRNGNISLLYELEIDCSKSYKVDVTPDGIVVHSHNQSLA